MTNAMIPVNTLQVNTFLLKQYESHVHVKTLGSLSDTVMGALTSQSLQPSKMGDGLAAAKGLKPKHAKKQVDRLLSNKNVEIGYFQNTCAGLLIGNRKRIYVAMDWTVFAKDAQMTITLRLVTTHGRATPLLWKTVSSKDLKGNKNKYLYGLLDELRKIVPFDCQVVILADREFGTLNCMIKIKEKLEFDYILRIKRNFTVIDKHAVKKLAYEWLNMKEATCIDDAKITVKNYPVKKVVICKEPGMKEMWCLASSLSDIATQTILNLYGKRWTTETSYRDEKDIYFGMGLKKSRIHDTERRDRILLISAIVIILLTLIGAASEAVGFDKYLKANTVKKRTHSLFAQGRLILKLLPKMPEEWKMKIFGSLMDYCWALKRVSEDVFVL